MRNKLCKITLAALLTVGIAATALAVDLNPLLTSPKINGSATTNLVVNFPAWPTQIQVNTSVTNFTKLDISTFKEVALSFTCQSTNAGCVSNVVWVVYDSNQAVAPTNAVGTSLNVVPFSYVTNVMNATTPVTTIATYTAAGKSATSSQSADTGIAGLPTLYVGYVTTLPLCAVTNYQIYLSGK